MWPENTHIHVTSVEEFHAVMEYYSEFGYRLADGYHDGNFRDYPYMGSVAFVGEIYEKRANEITGWHGRPDGRKTIEFDEWEAMYKMTPEFEPADTSALDALLSQGVL